MTYFSMRIGLYILFMHTTMALLRNEKTPSSTTSMNRSYFSSTIDNFILTNENEILGTLTSSENIFSITPKTTSRNQFRI